ncbi:hypothetical protein PR048_027945 [Dryococelus australis]|uniref:Uncharacterized protein n=1 Tax=Dryococelus australis TaxID=614101 RepID=A0ABQ9GHV8_9NEOP|nr:hypothetical protein PR048_027945 [Dryococelus australis]
MHSVCNKLAAVYHPFRTFGHAGLAAALLSKIVRLPTWLKAFCVPEFLEHGSHKGYPAHEATVAERLACSRTEGNPEVTERGSIPGWVTPGFSQVKIASDDAAGRWVSSGIFRFPHPCILAVLYSHHTSPSSALFKTSCLMADQPIGNRRSMQQLIKHKAGSQTLAQPNREYLSMLTSEEPPRRFVSLIRHVNKYSEPITDLQRNKGLILGHLVLGKGKTGCRLGQQQQMNRKLSRSGPRWRSSQTTRLPLRQTGFDSASWECGGRFPLTGGFSPGAPAVGGALPSPYLPIACARGLVKRRPYYPDSFTCSTKWDGPPPTKVKKRNLFTNRDTRIRANNYLTINAGVHPTLKARLQLRYPNQSPDAGIIYPRQERQERPRTTLKTEQPIEYNLDLT